jgi:2,4-diaminopentanoate dehydrogenase
VAARPGIVTYADLMPATSVLRPKALAPAPVKTHVEEPPQPRAPSGGSVAVEGKWNVIVKGPTGPQATEVRIQRIDGHWSGVQSGQGTESPMAELSIEDGAIRWVNHVTRPMKMKVEFKGVIEGERMSGKCKAGFMGSYPFTGTKV